MTNADEFFKRMYSLTEDDEAYVQSGFGSKRQVKSGSKTKVDTSPETHVDAKTTDGKGFGRSYDRNNRPNDHRPGSVDFPSQNGPSNPQSRWKDSWAKAGLEQSTRNAQRRQSGNYTNRKS